MAVTIQSVEKGSPAWKKGITAGEQLVAINGNVITDVLDYRFYMTDTHLTVELLKDGTPRVVKVQKDEYDDLGLDFETYLMDRQHHCKNKCVFCFVDQLPKGLRETLYFKDDDSRMSFFFGSYVTLTNMTEEEVRRIIKMRISPINISIHTTNPELRVKMLANPNAAGSLRYVSMLTEAGIKVNTQLVLCPGMNDGEEMRSSLYDLEKLYPNLQSIALVPVGLTKHREGLYPLRPMTRDEARANLAIAEQFGSEMLEKHGSRIAFPADELFVIAELPIPEADFYEEFEQLDDGVGIYSLLRKEFLEELEYAEGDELPREVSIACGTAAQPLLRALIDNMKTKYPNVTVQIYGVVNRLFGDTVNVSGLLCGSDLAEGLAGKRLGSKVILPSVMLRHEADRFLDDTTPQWLSEQLGVPVDVRESGGLSLFEAITQ
ncbi:MAG: DUF512 domain-containing protein [Angelakisella sp.]